MSGMAVILWMPASGKRLQPTTPSAIMIRGGCTAACPAACRERHRPGADRDIVSVVDQL
jgi:hypothetical protein